jgi:predicted phage tail protein
MTDTLKQRYSSSSEVQTISATDVISEGPIQGLVDGVASIFLNDIRQTEQKYGQKGYSREFATAEVRNGSNIAKLTLFDATLQMNPNIDAPRFFVLRDRTGIPCVHSSLTVKGSGANRSLSLWRIADPDGGSNWWPEHGLSIAPVNTGPRKYRSPGEYHPARIEEVSTGKMQTGRFFETKESGGNISTTKIEFSAGFFNGSAWLAMDNAYKEFKNSTGLRLYVDKVVKVKDISNPTTNSDGSSTYDLTLTENWVYSKEYTFNAAAVSNNTITLSPSNHELVTGDRIFYSTGGGTAVGNITPDTVSYYVIKESANTIKLATSRDAAFADTAITLTAGSGTSHTIQANEKLFDDVGYDFTDSEVIGGLSEAGETQATTGIQAQFRPGLIDQPPLVGEGGIGSSAVTNSLNLSIAQTNQSNFGGSQAPVVLQGISSAGFNLSSVQAEVADEIRIRWDYPAGFKGIDYKGRDKKTYIRYLITLSLKPEVGAAFSGPIYTTEVLHEGNFSNSVSFEETLDLSTFRPFSDFKITIERQDADEDPGYENIGRRNSDFTNVTKGSISSVTTIFKESMIYPLTAVAKVSFSSKSFQDVPTRSYHCRGMLVKVPSNYITREESGHSAKYTRKNGYDSGRPQDWDGTFRDFVYTNNPAWIFYDLVTNNRYGLGDFIKETDIDKYALYRIGKYCDEEVSDGKGGTEARYTLNTYLMKSTDAYKVMKDLLSNFVTIMYYLNGQIFPVQDSPSGPIYSFSKANVIDGAFSYESTGSKTRVNQMVVEWNNPDNNYELEPLIVENRRQIAESGVLISQNVIAYGCTSEGQATRYGRWKLWTAENQQEVVSFATGINGSYITPGDIILVQDSDRNAVRYSGRISNSGTLNTSTIPLDAPVTIDGTNNYELSILIQKPVAFLAQESASISFNLSLCSAGSTTTTVVVPSTSDLNIGMSVSGATIPNATKITDIVNSTTITVSEIITQSFNLATLTFTNNYVRGDIVDKAYIDVGTFVYVDINTSERASNAKASFLEGLLLNWKEDFRVETYTVDKTATGTGSQSSIVLSEPLSQTPLREDIWVLTEKSAGGAVIEGSGKEYKVLSMSQDSNNHYEISAVEHYDAKFDSIEEQFNTYVSEPLTRSFKSTDIIPPPEDAWVSVLLTEHEEFEDVKVYYIPAQGEFVEVTQPDGTTTQQQKDIHYQGAPYVEITHNIPDPNNPSPVLVAHINSSPSFTFKNVEPGKYEVQVRTVGPNGVKSLAVRRDFEVNARFRNRKAGYFPEAAHAGGTSDKGMEIVI